MPFRFLGDIAIADVAFEATAKTVEELFVEAGRALMSVMVEDLDGIRPVDHRAFEIRAPSIERLLFEYLQEFIYFKDAERLLLKTSRVSITGGEDGLVLRADAVGETIDRARHELNADVKAVTLHRFGVRETSEGWVATVVLDV